MEGCELRLTSQPPVALECPVCLWKPWVGGELVQFAFFEIEDGEVHLAFGEDVDGEDGFAGGKMEPGQGRGDVPVMPLTPCDRIGGGGSGGAATGGSAAFP